MCRSLKIVKFSNGLKTIGTNDYYDNGNALYGVFEGSTVEHVELPRTLKRIEYNAFKSCKDIESIVLPEELEYIG